MKIRLACITNLLVNLIFIIVKNCSMKHWSSAGGNTYTNFTFQLHCLKLDYCTTCNYVDVTWAIRCTEYHYILASRGLVTIRLRTWTASSGVGDIKFVICTPEYPNKAVKTTFLALFQVGLLFTHKNQLLYNLSRTHPHIYCTQIEVNNINSWR